MSGEIITTGDHGELDFPQEPSVRLRDLEFTDLYMSVNGQVLIRGVDDAEGPLTEVPDDVIMDIDHLHMAVLAEGQKNRKEFFLDFDEVRYRVSKIQSIDGDWFTLRKSKTKIPRLKELGGFPPPIMKHLAWLGGRSGLILLAGATGQGKTTTACTLLREYLLAFGDIAITIEDPPELMMNGAHGNFGRCFQLRLEEGETFGSALVSAMRYTPRYIFLGELRKSSDASQALRAAISGHLVISTIHAGSIEEAINSMIKLTSAGEESVEFSRDLLANGLAGVIHQKLVKTKGSGNSSRKRLLMKSLFFGEDNGIRSLIRDGNVNQLGTFIEQQQSRVKNGMTPLDLPGSERR